MQRIPIIIRAVITGLLVVLAGTLPWALLAGLNVKYGSNIPWSVVPAAIYIWFYWQYVKGKWWPSSTAAFRKKNCRANKLSTEVWGAAIIAGIIGLVALLVFQGLLNRVIRLPAQSDEGLRGLPVLTATFLVIMGSLFAGITEESGFRGYLQGPIERRHGPVPAIFITGLFFSFAHFTHPEFSLSLLPFYMAVAVIYGTIAYMTNSILPGIVLHAGGNILVAFDLIFRGQSEWQRPANPKPLIWESGTDTSFWLLCGGTLVATAIAIWAFRNLRTTVAK